MLFGKIVKKKMLFGKYLKINWFN